MQSSNPSLPEVFGRYRIQRKLGEGAMGAVYVAEDTQLKRRVALKIPQLRPDGSPDLLDRFRLEAQSAATLRNPNICPVHDVGVIDGQHFISMAYIEGKSLAEVLRSDGRIPERQILLLVRKLALALDDAHQHGIVHRDLKPANIMIDNRGEPIVMDFGLAFQTGMPSERLTVDGQIIGSPAYMSPEQVGGNIKSLTQAVDQHALGVTLYELLTKELPYQGSLVSIVNQIVNQPAPSPRKLRPDIDPRVEELCLKLMAKKQEQRYPSMRDVADRITTILKAELKACVAVVSTKPVVDVSDESPAYFNGIRDRVSELLESADLREALAVVKQCASTKNAEIREWARQMQQQIVSRIQERKRQLSILANVAAKLIREHDYEEAVNVLAAIPSTERTEEIQDLYSDAETKAEEVSLLLKEIQQAIASDQPKELAPLIRRFMQLKPGNASIRSLAEDLKKYGAEEVIRIRRRRQNYFDPAPPLFQATHIAYAIAGIVALVLATFFGAMIYLAPAGTVVVEVFDPRISINFLNQEIKGTSSERRFLLKPSVHPQFSVKVDGSEAIAQEITVKNRETKRIAARLKEGKLDLQITSDLPGFSVPQKGKVVTAPASEAAMLAKVTAPAVAADGEWLNLMSEPGLNAASSDGIQWKKSGDKLIGTVTEKADSGWLWKISERTLTGDFDLELDFEVVGADFVEVGLPLKESVGNLKIAKEGTALHWVDGRDLDWKRNRLPLGNEKVRLANSTRQRLKVTVRHAGTDVSLNAEVNGEVVCQFNGLRSRISTPKIMYPTPGQLKLATELSRQADSRIEIYHYRVRELGPGLPQSKPESDPPKSTPDSSTKPVNTSRILIDADFSKSNGGFANLDVDHMLSEHRDGEYRYVGKQVGWWWNGIEPAVGKKENRDLEDFTIELALRMVGKKKGWFVVRFGLAQKDQLSLCIDDEGAIRLLRGGYAVLVPPTLPRNLKPIDQFNTVKMSVEKKSVRVMVNGEQLFEKKLEQYVGGTVRIWLAPDEVPFDVRLQRLKLETPVLASPRPIDKEVRKLAGHNKTVRGIQFLPGNEQAVSVADDKSFKIWNVITGKVIHDIAGHPAEVTSVSVSEDGRRALTGCADGQARLWDLETRQVVKSLKGHTRPVVSVVLSRDAKMAWAAADDGTIRAWDLKSTAGAKLIAAAGTGTTIEVSANGKIIAAGNNLGQVHIQAGKVGATLVGHGAGDIGGIAFTPDDSQVVTASEDGTLRLWQLSSSKEIHRFSGGGASFKSVSVTSNGRYALAGNIDGKIHAFDLQTGDTVHEIRADGSVNQLLALSPDNHHVLTAGDDDTDLHLWELPGKLWQAR